MDEILSLAFAPFGDPFIQKYVQHIPRKICFKWIGFLSWEIRPSLKTLPINLPQFRIQLANHALYCRVTL